MRVDHYGAARSRGTVPLHVTETRPPSCDGNGSSARLLPTARRFTTATRKLRSRGGSCGTSLRDDVASYVRLIAEGVLFRFSFGRWECYRVIVATGLIAAIYVVAGDNNSGTRRLDGDKNRKGKSERGWEGREDGE